MILFGRKARALLEDVERQGRELASVQADVDRLAKEVVRLMTEVKQPEGNAIVSVLSQEGEPWLKR